MNFIGIIPCRLNSTRLPNKPLQKVSNRFLVEIVYNSAKNFFNHNLFIATDSTEIYNVCKNFTNNILITSNEHKSGTDRCAEAISIIEKEIKKNFDIVFNIQCDELNLNNSHFESLLNAFYDPFTQIATLAKKIEKIEELTNINKVKVVKDNNNFALYFSRFPIPYQKNLNINVWLLCNNYYKHIGIYAFKKDVLLQITKLPQTNLEICESLEQLRWLQNSYKIKIVETNIDTISIDTEEDLNKANQFYFN